MSMRFDPVTEMNEMTRAVSRLLGEPAGVDGAGYTIPVDLFETRDDLFVIAQLPGVRRDAIAVELVGNTLVLTATRPLPSVAEGRFVHIETPYGRYERRIGLGSVVQGDAVTASWQDGMLTVRLPKVDAARPRRIEIGESAGEPIPALAGDDSSQHPPVHA